MGYYDGTKLLSLSDANGDKPEIYMVTTNRSGGKTTYFGRMVVNRWFKDHSRKFALLYRFNNELDDVADKFYKDIGSLFFQGSEMTSKLRSKGTYAELRINDEICGYAIALNNADKIKKMSHLFSDVESIIFDEFQSEVNHYCNDEVNKFVSIHTSIARGQGKFSRYVPVYMIANPVTILNPYYVIMGITDRLNDSTNFLRGNGWVLEQGFVEDASIAQQTSAFNRAFENSDYTAYNAQAVYLNDSKVFIEKVNGRSQYVATIKFRNREFAIRRFDELGIIYCDGNADSSYPLKISVTLDDHNVNYVMLKQNEFFIDNMRYYFNRGCFRFKDLRCKDAVMNLLKY